MGVSGSGKTVVGEALARRLAWRFEDADQWHPAANVEKMRRGVPLTEEDRVPWLDALSAAIARWVADKQDVVLACSALRRGYRDTLRGGLSRECLRFVYLKGDYQTIDRRLKARVGHFMPEALLRTQFATLEAPDSSEALAVSVTPPIPAIVDSIIAVLGPRPASDSP